MGCADYVHVYTDHITNLTHNYIHVHSYSIYSNRSRTLNIHAVATLNSSCTWELSENNSSCPQKVTARIHKWHGHDCKWQTLIKINDNSLELVLQQCGISQLYFFHGIILVGSNVRYWSEINKNNP